MLGVWQDSVVPARCGCWWRQNEAEITVRKPVAAAEAVIGCRYSPLVLRIAVI